MTTQMRTRSVVNAVREIKTRSIDLVFLDINLPDKKFKKVVLPEPDGPKIAVKDCAGIIPF